MAYKIFKLDKKSADWYVASLVDAAGDVHENVSINKVSKKGDLFPNFETLEKDQKVEGRIWESDTKKKYLFAPKGGAKAPFKPTTERQDREYDRKSDEEAEYPVSEKLETVLNKLVGMQNKLEKIIELLEPKKKASVGEYEYPPNSEEEPPF